MSVEIYILIMFTSIHETEMVKLQKQHNRKKIIKAKQSTWNVSSSYKVCEFCDVFKNHFKTLLQKEAHIFPYSA